MISTNIKSCLTALALVPSLLFESSATRAASYTITDLGTFGEPLATKSRIKHPLRYKQLSRTLTY